MVCLWEGGCTVKRKQTGTIHISDKHSVKYSTKPFVFLVHLFFQYCKIKLKLKVLRIPFKAQKCVFQLLFRGPFVCMRIFCVLTKPELVHVCVSRSEDVFGSSQPGLLARPPACLPGSQAERRLMKALAGLCNKEQIIMSGHCPPPPTPPGQTLLLPPAYKSLISNYQRQREGAVYSQIAKKLKSGIALRKEINKQVRESARERRPELLIPALNHTHLSHWSFGMRRGEATPLNPSVPPPSV